MDTFKPEPYWLLTTHYRGCAFQAEDGKYTDKSKATKALSLVQSEAFHVDGVTQKKGAEAPPQLYDLTSLQVDCNKRYGYTAETTLNTIQSLYEKKLTTYPRVDTRYLSDDIYQKCPGIMQGLSTRYKETIPLLSKPLRKSRRVFDTEKVTDHHAIIPTGKPASILSEKEQKVYDLIARRFICCFYEDCTFWTTVVKGHSGIIQFRAMGKEIIGKGWKELFANVNEIDSEEGEAFLPKFTEREHGQHTPELKEKQTSAPKPYTEATLLRAMETAGKFVEDEELRAALKQNGIGRPSSRAGIIETLFKRQYIIREKNTLIPSPIGIALIETIKSDLLKSCELTGLWEKKLRDIEAGRYNPNDFMNELKEQLMDVINAVMSDKESHQITSCKRTSEASRKTFRRTHASSKVKGGMTCPLCGLGKIFKAKFNYRCSRWKEGCNYSHPFEKK
jgi:DNA topoisomerase-3